MKRSILLLSIFLTFPALATDFAGSRLLIPIAGRTAGALGSQWKTDLFVSNASGEGEGTSVAIVFVNQNGTETVVNATLAPRETRAFPDAIRNAFLQESATGMIRIVASSGDALVTARARIYNTGAGRGEYGQTVQAEPLSKLSRDAILPGLTAFAGDRTNVGIANPEEVPAAAFVSLHEASGQMRSGYAIQIAPRSVYFLNDALNQFQNPPASLDNATIRVRSSHGVYAYASIVRAGSGDADFVAATAVELDPSDPIVPAQCATPAHLGLAPLPAQGWIVIFRDADQPEQKTAELEARHNFKAKDVYIFGGFYAPLLTQAQIAALRCEPAVKVIEQNGRVPMP